MRDACYCKGLGDGKADASSCGKSVCGQAKTILVYVPPAVIRTILPFPSNVSAGKMRSYVVRWYVLISAGLMEVMAARSTVSTFWGPEVREDMVAADCSRY